MNQASKEWALAPRLVRAIAQLKESYGPLPVLSTENMQAYEETMLRFVVALNPQDWFETALVKDVIDGTWEAARWTRHKAVSIHRRHRDRLESQARQRKAAAQRKAEFKKRIAESKAEPPTEPEEAIDHLVEDIDAMLLEPATELDHNRALETGIEYVSKLDKLQMMAIARRNNALDQLQQYRETCCFRVHRDTDESFHHEPCYLTDRLGRPMEKMATPEYAARMNEELGVVPYSELEKAETPSDSPSGSSQ
jgi:hypothetical protein